MKILQIGSSLKDWGGIERYITYLTEGLLDRGHEVHVISPPGSPLAERCPGIHHGFSLNGQFQLTAIPWFRDFFCRNSFDFAHVHFSPDFVIPARMAKRSASRVVMTRHLALPWKGLKRNAYAKTFDHFIAVSDAVRNSLIEESRIEPTRVTTAKAGCPPLVPDASESTPTEGFAVGFFGRLSIEKGVDILLDAAETIDPKVRIHIFGTGPEEDRLKSHRNASRVEFHGFVPDVANAMESMNVIAIPSTWAEAFPYSALEAMHLGKPIIASNVGGLPEQVQDGKTGILVPPRDASALAAAIQEMAEAPQYAEAMGQKGRSVAQTEFTVAKFAERIEHVYLDVLERGTSATTSAL